MGLNVLFVHELMNPEIIEKLRGEIAAAQGQEVMARGVVNPETGLIDDVKVLARGHSTAAPAIIAAFGPAMVMIHNHPSGRLAPSEADLRVASVIGNKGAGFMIVDNAVEDGYMVVEPYMPRERQRLKTGDIVDFFEPNGSLSRGLTRYEYREQQMEMVRSIVYGFNSRRHLLVEAGTGTGKSMAYLVPAIYWAVTNEEKVVVSTNTINLQEQLFYKDIPLLQKTLTPLLPREFRTVLVKGRKNYICLRKLNYINQGYEELEPDEKRVMEEINYLVSKEEIGSRSEFPFQPSYELWEKVAAEAETCLRSKCPHYRGCFLQLARKEAAGADVLIVNHHLLFADLSVRKERGDGEVAVLPKYRHLILDEAHNLEHVATEYLGYQINRYGFMYFLQHMYSTKGHNRQHGLLLGIRDALTKAKISKEQKDSTLGLIDLEIIPVFLKVQDFGHHFFNQIAEFFRHQENTTENKLRLTRETANDSLWQELVCPAADDLQGTMNQLGRKLGALYDEIEEMKSLPDHDSHLVELEGRLMQLQRMMKAIGFIISQDDDNYVYWVEVFYRKNELSCTIQAAPLDIASEVRENLVEVLDTIVFTSATLAVDGRFDYFRENLGLNHERVDELLVGSPFNYAEQAMVAVVRDVSAPNMTAYTREVQACLQELLEVMRGRTLVLFTSYRALNTFYEGLKEPLEAKGILIYKQGDSSRQQIIQNFKEGDRGVIFGTASFWEGIDIQGEDLSCVVIMKLPFQVPSEPVVEARVERMEAAGKDSFSKFMLPNAVIKFKQGFGRLVRSKEDRGVVVVFDPRIYTKSYGKVFLRSLPQNTAICINSFEDISKKVKQFFAV